jgi:predicted transcriptional regulator YheO
MGGPSGVSRADSEARMPVASAWFSLIKDLGPAIGAAIGGTSAFGGVIAAQWMTARREREVRLLEAEEKRKHQWAELQRQGLYDLQDAVAALATSAAEIEALSRRAKGRSNPEILELLETLYEKGINYGDAILRVIKYLNRVDDDEVRSLTREVIHKIGSYQKAASNIGDINNQALEIVKKEMSTAFARANARIGEVLRGLHR